jgi:hypothetical protein
METKFDIKNDERWNWKIKIKNSNKKNKDQIWYKIKCHRKKLKKKSIKKRFKTK